MPELPVVADSGPLIALALIEHLPSRLIPHRHRP